MNESERHAADSTEPFKAPDPAAVSEAQNGSLSPAPRAAASAGESPASTDDTRTAVSDEWLYAALMKADRSESLGPIAMGLAEEMNELLTQILGAVSASPRGAGGDPLADIEAACLAGREVTRRLQVLARGGDGARTLVSPRNLLEEAAKTAGAATSVEILLDVKDGTDPVWVDPSQIGQAFRNLIRNSLEALSPAPHRPRVLLRASNTALDSGRVSGLPDGDYVEFEVRDNGCGIPAGSLDKIWEPFFTTRKHGAGLGLPAALSAVRRHGGQICVDSEVGVGTVFTVFIPRGNPPGAVSARPAPSDRFRTGRILVVEDNPRIRAAAGGMLERLNYKCDLAPNGAEAIAHYRRYLDVGRPYDLVLLDLNLPGEPGEGIFKDLRALDPDARILATSGAVSEEAGPRCMDLGFCGVVAKPYRLSELGQAIQTVLG